MTTTDKIEEARAAVAAAERAVLDAAGVWRRLDMDHACVVLGVLPGNEQDTQDAANNGLREVRIKLDNLCVAHARLAELERGA